MAKNDTTVDEPGQSGAALVHALTTGEVAVVEDREAMALRMMQQTLNAQTADDVLSESGTTSPAELLGVPLSIRDFIFRKSEIEGSTGVYAVIDAVNQQTGEILAISTGSSKVLAQVARLKDLGNLPFNGVEFYEVGKAKTGEDAPLGLRKVNS